MEASEDIFQLLRSTSISQLWKKFLFFKQQYYYGWLILSLIFNQILVILSSYFQAILFHSIEFTWTQTAYKWLLGIWVIITVSDKCVGGVNDGVSYTQLHSYQKLCLESLLFFYFLIIGILTQLDEARVLGNAYGQNLFIGQILWFAKSRQRNYSECTWLS